MTNTMVSCPECGDRFLVPVEALSDNLQRAVPESAIAEMCGCLEVGA